MNPGRRLLELRYQKSFSLREVEARSRKLARILKQKRLITPFSRVAEIETQGIVPNIYRAYALSQIYDIDLNELLSWYGIPKGRSRKFLY